MGKTIDAEFLVHFNQGADMARVFEDLRVDQGRYYATIDIGSLEDSDAYLVRLDGVKPKMILEVEARVGQILAPYVHSLMSARDLF